jgi:hypothetical protein
VRISAKYKRKTLSGLVLSFICDASLSFYPLGPPVFVYYTALKSRGVCPFQDYWQLSLFTWPTLTGILLETGSIVEIAAPWYTFRTSLN